MRTRAGAALGTVVALAGWVGGHALGAPPQPSPRPGAVSPGVPAAAKQPLPDISVNAAWIGSAANADPAPLGPNPTVGVGETVVLGCDVGISGSVPAGAFKVEWFVDGAPVCSGEFSPPECAWAYPLTHGNEVCRTYVVQAAGPHTYRCAADRARQVAERNESNNVSQWVRFTAVATSAPRPPVAQRWLASAPRTLR